ncbi:MAG: hypothetical protein BM556_08965 [Bacteriovorax sp. MedPE-SWde]|nr:MAG: hypothetical protein BM556_08965 [Bacteriovorax sp. MedPE-SWde]
MKVLISVVGRFHAFDLARSLYKHNILHKLVTTYPKFVAKKFGIPRSHVISEAILEVLARLSRKFSFLNYEKINNLVKLLHDKNCSRYVSKSDVFIGWSGISFNSMIRAKKLGIPTILERGSSHVRFQNLLLKEEFESLGLTQELDFEKIKFDEKEYEITDYVSIPSTFVLESFLSQGFPKEKLIVNPYGVDVDQFPVENNRTEHFKIIFVGGGKIAKGFHYLLQALHELNDPEIELIHVGHFAEEMNHFREKYYNAKVSYRGIKPQAELYKYYGEAHAFVLPSLTEGMAMVQLQAMCCALPILSTTNTGGSDLITEGKEGFIVPIRDVGALSEKILFFKNNRELTEEMGRKGREKVLNNFTWEHYGDRYVQNIKERLS